MNARLTKDSCILQQLFLQVARRVQSHNTRRIHSSSVQGEAHVRERLGDSELTACSVLGELGEGVDRRDGLVIEALRVGTKHSVLDLPEVVEIASNLHRPRVS